MTASLLRRILGWALGRIFRHSCERFLFWIPGFVTNVCSLWRTRGGKKRRGKKEKGLGRIDSAEVYFLSTELGDVLSCSCQPHMWAKQSCPTGHLHLPSRRLCFASEIRCSTQHHPVSFPWKILFKVSNYLYSFLFNINWYIRTADLASFLRGEEAPAPACCWNRACTVLKCCCSLQRMAGATWMYLRYSSAI